MFIVTSATTDGTLADHAKFSIGATDGTRQRACGTRSEHGVANTNVDRKHSNNRVIVLPDNTAPGADYEASFNSWITDGIRVTNDTQTTNAELVTCILFGGTDLSAHVSGFRSRKTANDVCEVSRLSGTCTNVGAADSGGSGQTRVDVSGTPFAATDEGNVFTFTATGNEYTIAEYVDSNTVDLQGDASGESNTDTFTFDGPNFTSDLLIGFGNRSEPNNAWSTASAQYMGFCKRAGTIVQNGCSHDETNGNSANVPRVYVETTRLVRNISGANTYGNVEITAFDSTGFDATTRATADCYVSYLALAFNSAVNFNVWNYTTPTSDGSATDAGPNFTPQFVMYTMTQETNTGANQYTDEAGSWGISTFTADEQFSNAMILQRLSPTTDTASISDNIPVNLPDDDDSTGPTATYGSMAATGPTLTWADVQGGNMAWGGLAIEEFTAGGRTTKNTRAAPLGVQAGQNRVQQGLLT
jgi:hypothetical protein